MHGLFWGNNLDAIQPIIGDEDYKAVCGMKKHLFG